MLQKAVAEEKVNGTEERILTFEKYMDLSAKVAQLAPEARIAIKALEKVPIATGK